MVGDHPQRDRSHTCTHRINLSAHMYLALFFCGEFARTCQAIEELADERVKKIQLGSLLSWMSSVEYILSFICMARARYGCSASNRTSWY